MATMTSLNPAEPADASIGVPQLAPEPESKKEEVHLPVPAIDVERVLKAAGMNNNLNPSSIRSYSWVDGSTVTLQDVSAVAESHDHFNNSASTIRHLEVLEKGGCLFSFSCKHELDPYETDMVDCVVNLSAFDDETVENGVPHFDVVEQRRLVTSDDDKAGSAGTNDKELSNNNDQVGSDSDERGVAPTPKDYTFLLARCGYLFTGVSIEQLLADPSLLSTLDYQQQCQPVGTTVWDDYENMKANNFRITKPIIPYLYNFTIQFQVSKLPPDDLDKLAHHVGIRVDGGVLLERTKRSVPPKDDATKKCKSVLLYTHLGRGVWLVTHLTVMVQQGLPQVIELAIHTFGQWGLGETIETAERTRYYLQNRLPFQPKEEEDEEGQVFLDATNSADEKDESHDSSDDATEDDFYDC